MSAPISKTPVKAKAGKANLGERDEAATGTEDYSCTIDRIPEKEDIMEPNIRKVRREIREL